MLGYIIAIAVMVMFSAYFSATETAFSSLNRTKIKTMAEKGDRRAKLVLAISEQYDKMISTILIGNNIVNIAAASLATVLFIKLLDPTTGPSVSTAVLTVVILIFGEITPKSIAKDCPEVFCKFAAPLLRLLMWVLTPINFLFSLWKKLVAKVLRLQPDDKMSQEELLTLVEEVRESGSIDEEEGTLLSNAIEFTECAAEDILTHRVELEAIEVRESKEEIARRFTKSRYSRLLVYKDNIDNIIGVLHQKDFYKGTGVTEKSIRDILSPVVFVTPQVRINGVLQQMQREKVHVAVVLDEYGGTYGIITMEDILEELVGEIWDEHDEVTETFKETAENVYRVDASVTLDDFFDFFDIDSDSETTALNSWVAEQLQKVPREGDEFEYGDLTIRVLAISRHRLVAIQVTRRVPAAESAE